MKFNATPVLALGASALLTACGSNNASYADLMSDMDAMEATYAAAPARTELPANGTATYAGYIGGDLSDGRDLIGRLELTADFAAMDLSGSASHFTDSDDQDFAGILSVTASSITQTVVGADFEVAGTLAGDLVADSTTYDTAIDLDGNFFGGTGTDVPDAVGGDADGLLIGGAGALLFTGDFIAE